MSNRKPSMALTHVESWILRHPTAAFAVAIVAFILWHGVAALPQQYIQGMVQEVRLAGTPHASTSHHMESPAYYLLAHLVGAGTVAAYLAYCAVFILAAVLWQHHCTRRSMRVRPAFIMSLLFLGHPVFYMLTSFAGLSDPLLVLCTAVLLHGRTTATMVIAAFIGALVHPAMAFIAPAVLVLRHLSDREAVHRRHIILVVLGIAGGVVASQTYLHVMQIEYVSRWEFLAGLSPVMLVANVTRNPALVAYSLLFSVWLPVVLSLHQNGRRSTRYTGTYLFIMLAALAVTFLTIDTTRVMALLTWAPTMHMLSQTLQQADTGTEDRDRSYMRIMALSACIGLAMPRFFIWNGVLHAPGHDLLFDLLSPLFT